MVDDDIYGNKRNYERFVRTLDRLKVAPGKDDGKRKYWVKYTANLAYFRKLIKAFEVRDNSFIHRLRVMRSLLIVTFSLEKDLVKATRDDIDDVMTYANSVNHSPKSKENFVTDLKFIWRQLFPERDEKGRVDETMVPYVVRHLNTKVDKSRQKVRPDKFSLDEFERLVQAFASEPRMQALLMVSIESLGRPQEILGRCIGDVEMHDNYAKITISEHGKEGIGILRIIDSHPYLAKWLAVHPLRKNKSAPLFVNLGSRNRNKRMTPFAASKLIRERCAAIGIDKPITLYSLKRNGVTMLRLSGKSDLDIQHIARWTSTKQIHTYDMSGQEESFKIELIKRGKIKADKDHKHLVPTIKKCLFCETENGFSEGFCTNCKRPLDRETIEQEAKQKEEQFHTVSQQLQEMAAKQERLETMFLQALAHMGTDKAKKKLTPELVKKFIEVEKRSV